MEHSRSRLPDRLFLLFRDSGVVVGALNQNAWHAHYPLQVTIGLDGSYPVHVEAPKGSVRQVECDDLVIASSVPHWIPVPPGRRLLLLAVHPASCLGVRLGRALRGPTGLPDPDWAEKLRESARQLLASGDERTFRSDMERANAVLLEGFEEGSDCLDPRILKVLRFFEENFEEVFPAAAVARKVGLSESRFLHLFKQETGVTFRRMQIWMRLNASFRRISECRDLTELAHRCGFADSSHYSRSFKETFGVSPSLLFRNSRFIQAP